MVNIVNLEGSHSQYSVVSYKYYMHVLQLIIMRYTTKFNQTITVTYLHLAPNPHNYREDCFGLHFQELARKIIIVIIIRMRLGAQLIVTVFAILLCSFPLCSGRKGRQRNLTPKGKKQPPPTCQTNCSACGNSSYSPPQLVFNVDDFGAKANVSDTDNLQAFKKAWDSACNSADSAKILVPKGNTYSIKQINFTGPCQSKISVEIQGTIQAFSEMYDFPKRLWIKFGNVANMDVYGGGILDGMGAVWWKNTCKIKKTKTKDAQQMHVVFDGCDGVDASNLTVVAPEKSPNTDGIHITKSSNVKVQDSTIGTGDDCISIVNGTRNVEGGSGYAMNIVFDNIVMKNVSNPIIVDQNYCDTGKNCQQEPSGVQIQNVVFSDISGTSATKDAITLDCSQSVPCRNIILENVKLTAVKAGGKVDAVCSNINQTLLINTSPTCWWQFVVPSESDSERR
ncbi:pectin lyase-like superfamily protein [Striga asiatica]|uniref:Pectin lyase-like superfamily protein n=1 Tax=Striga asiatica TaxID=4170 RepID=A0A5A7PH00_STRAF|nr:pectin lyase-like superfamily protein [Striga asiatica]